MDNNMVSKIWVGMSTTDLYWLQFKIQGHLQTKLFKISNITSAILPFSHKNTN